MCDISLCLGCGSITRIIQNDQGLYICGKCGYDKTESILNLTCGYLKGV